MSFAFKFLSGISLLFAGSLAFSQDLPRLSPIDGATDWCATTASHAVKCWNIGIESTSEHESPRVMQPQVWGNFTDAIQVSLKDESLRCVLHQNGEVSCGGFLYLPKRGGGVQTIRTTNPQKIAGFTGIIQIATGGQHLCALRNDRRVLCWGTNNAGQLGLPPSNTPVAVPTEVPGLNNVQQISAGFNFTCATKRDRTAFCWGLNDYGMLGNESTIKTHVPQAVHTRTGVNSIHAGDENACAILTDGTAQCWGVNQYGQLGNGEVGEFKTRPVDVQNLEQIADISVGRLNFCAITANLQAFCWGINVNGEAGSGVATEAPVRNPSHVGTSTFVPVIGITGGSTKCALVGFSDVQCWGVMSEDDDMHLPFESIATPRSIGSLN